MTSESMEEWTRARLGDVADVNWGDTSVTKAAYVGEGFRAYSASGPDGYLPYAQYRRTGVVVSAIGADCGKTWLAKGEWSCIKNTIRFWSKVSEVDTGFLYWVTRDPATWPKRGSAQPFISQGDARALEIQYPPLSEQRAIAHILGTLDDKIELNRRMSETLETIARAIFKSWFVDFDPVRAKAEGRDPGLPKHIADVFPDRLVESELGEIPVGWEVKSLDQIARFVNGLALQKHPPTADRWLPVIKIAQLRSGRPDGADKASSDLEPDYIVADGDILFSWSGSLECVLWAGGPGALNQHLFKVTPVDYPRWLCYFGVHQHLDDFRHIAAGKATTMGHIQRHHLSTAKVAVPPKPTLRAVDDHLTPPFESHWRRAVEARTVGAIRDSLLPKLMSGELRVKYGEKFGPRAV